METKDETDSEAYSNTVGSAFLGSINDGLYVVGREDVNTRFWSSGLENSDNYLFTYENNGTAATITSRENASIDASPTWRLTPTQLQDKQFMTSLNDSYTEVFTTGVQFLPVAGDLYDLYDFGKSLSVGDYTGAAFAATGFIPLLGDAAQTGLKSGSG